MPVGVYAGAVVAFLAALLSTFRGVVVIPVFVVVSVVAVRFVTRQIAGLQASSAPGATDKVETPSA